MYKCCLISTKYDSKCNILLFFRFVVVCGDGEYIIYTAMALRNKSFGSAQEFVWALDSSEYAVRESSTSVKIFKNFKEKKVFKPEYGAEGMSIILFYINFVLLIFSMLKLYHSMCLKKCLTLKKKCNHISAKFNFKPFLHHYCST